MGPLLGTVFVGKSGMDGLGIVQTIGSSTIRVVVGLIFHIIRPTGHDSSIVL